MLNQNCLPFEELNHRIEELETRSTFQDDLVETLNQALIQQQGDLIRLKTVVESLVSQVEKMHAVHSTDKATELPPHY